MPTDYSAGLRRNEGRQCSTPGCSNSRKHLHAVCSRCLVRFHMFGHGLLGRAITKTETAPFRRTVGALLDTNPSHEVVLASDRVVTEWLTIGGQHHVPDEQGIYASRFPGSREAHRLFRAAVTSRQVIEAVLGTWLFLAQEPRQRTDLEWVFALGRAVIYQIPGEERTSYVSGKATRYSKKPRSSDIKAIGEWARSHLAPLYALVSQGASALDAVVAEKRKARAAPLVLPEVDGRGIRKPRVTTYASFTRSVTG